MKMRGNPVGVDMMRRALADVYYDVPLALDFLHEAGRTRTPASAYEAMPLVPRGWLRLYQPWQPPAGR